MSKLKEQYKKEIAPKLKEQFGLRNPHQVPVVLKVTVNTGLSTKRDAKFVETLQETLQAITGQKPIVVKAKKSIAGFKLRENVPNGVTVTLRGPRMWDFIDKLVSVVFPRVRDFQGIKPSVIDASGNFSYGFKEHIAFPEVNPDAIDQLHGLQVNITTTAENKEQGRALFEALGFPFKKTDM